MQAYPGGLDARWFKRALRRAAMEFSKVPDDLKPSPEEFRRRFGGTVDA